MRKAIIGIIMGCGLAAMATPTLACPYSQASSDQQAPQRTASAQDGATANTQ